MSTGGMIPECRTIAGMRRRGYTPEAIRTFCDKVGIAKRENLIELSLLEFCVRDHLNDVAQRRMCVLNPIELELTNYPEDQVEWLPAENNPENEADGSRTMPFSRHLLIERDDFMIDAPKKYYRMSPGRNVRLKHGYIIHCTRYETNDEGEVVKVLGEVVENSKSGEDTSGVKAKGTLHWVSKKHAIPVEVRMYDRLFTVPEPTRDEEKDYLEFFNSESMKIVAGQGEPDLAKASFEEKYQFLRKGYFVLDKSSTSDHLIFNQTVGLRDSWKK